MAKKDLNVPQRVPGDCFGYPVAANTRIFGRALVALTAAGLAVPVGATDGIAFAGIAKESIDNLAGGDGEKTVTVLRDVRGFVFDATASDLNKPVYATDDETLTLTAGGNAMRVGVIVGIGDGRVWVNLNI